MTLQKFKLVFLGAQLALLVSCVHTPLEEKPSPYVIAQGKKKDRCLQLAKTLSQGKMVDAYVVMFTPNDIIRSRRQTQCYIVVRKSPNQADFLHYNLDLKTEVAHASIPPTELDTFLRRQKRDARSLRQLREMANGTPTDMSKMVWVYFDPARPQGKASEYWLPQRLMGEFKAAYSDLYKQL